MLVSILHFHNQNLWSHMTFNFVSVLQFSMYAEFLPAYLVNALTTPLFCPNIYQITETYRF